jgi:hypothetical protein
VLCGGAPLLIGEHWIDGARCDDVNWSGFAEQGVGEANIRTRTEPKELSKVTLPAVLTSTSPALLALTKALGVPREILATDEEIEAAWATLPRVLAKVPPELRTEGLARMCVAVAAGLFDSAINYVWNASIVELRARVSRFGLNVVQQVIGDATFDENDLVDLKDAELLELCLKLNLITEDGFFFLDQCRDIRNNFSAAHPTIGTLDDHEFISFVNRCAKHALGNEINPVGVDIQGFIAAVKGARFETGQLHAWTQRLEKTHEAQRDLLLGTVHGIFCDPGSTEQTRLNALAISKAFATSFTPKIRSDLIDRHQDYLAKGDKDRHKASQIFFEKLSLLNLLSESERHSLVSNACKKLMSVHNAFSNFYNEPPFAERLMQIVGQSAIPETARYEFVEVVVTCAVGNPWGTSRAAYPYYKSMIQGFSPAEVALMLALPLSKTVVGQRIDGHTRCKDAFKRLVGLLDPASVPTKVKAAYRTWIK